MSLEAKAHALGLSPDELMELAFGVLEDAADEQAVELRALVDQVNRTVPETLKIVDDRHRQAQERLKGPKANPRRRHSSTPNQVDVHVGGRVRLRRQMLGLTEEQVAASLGLTRGQLQRFENGVNRIGAARLYGLSRVLDVPVSFFFDDLDPLPTNPKQLELAHNFARIPDEADQESVIEHAHSLATAV